MNVLIMLSACFGVLTDPENAFLTPDEVDIEQIFAFQIDGYIENSDEILELLGWATIVREPPAYLAPHQMIAHISLEACRRLYQALWLRRIRAGSPFDVHPQIQIYPAVVIERRDSVFIVVVDRSVGHSTLPTVEDDLPHHLDDVAAKTERLMATVSEILPGLPGPSKLEAFPGFPQPTLRRGAFSGAFLVDGGRSYVRAWPFEADHFVLVTGEHSHFALRAPTIACAAHDWTECNRRGVSVGDGPILVPTVNPASYFTSSQAHHCVHRTIHARRIDICKIQAFETFFCCQACIFSPICWEGVADLPCGMSAQQQSGAQARTAFAR
jgi:hypothetical protein